MIDNLRITITDENFSEEKLEGKTYNHLYPVYSKTNINGEDKKSFCLHVRYNKEKKEEQQEKKEYFKVKITIEGSIRKWCFGKYSTDDLNKEQFEDSIKQIAESLNIDYNLFLQGTITQCEVGLSFLTSLEPRIINTHIKKKKGYGLWMFNDYKTVIFKNKLYDLKFYDKYQEMLATSDKDKQKDKDKHKQLLNEVNTKINNGEYCYRIEFTLINKQSFEKANLKGLNTVNGLIDKYMLLLEYFVETFDSLKINDQIEWKNKAVISKDKFLIILGVLSLGRNKFIAEYREHALVDLNGEVKTGTSARNAKSLAGKEVKKILKEYTSSVKIQKILNKDLTARIDELYAN